MRLCSYSPHSLRADPARCLLPVRTPGRRAIPTGAPDVGWFRLRHFDKGTQGNGGPQIFSSIPRLNSCHKVSEMCVPGTRVIRLGLVACQFHRAHLTQSLLEGSSEARPRLASNAMAPIAAIWVLLCVPCHRPHCCNIPGRVGSLLLPGNSSQGKKQCWPPASGRLREEAALL